MNNARLKSLDLFLDIFEDDPFMNQFPLDLLNWTARRIEKGCHDANIDKAIDKNVPRYWEDPQFQEQYSSIVYKVAINIDPTSSVNQAQPINKQRFLINKIHSVVMLMFMLELHLYNDLQTDPDVWIQLNDPVWVDVIELSHLGYMNSDILNPHINEPYKQQIRLRSQQQVEEKTTEMYSCHQCKARNARCRTVQTRSGDEGYTLFLSCKPCGYRWRIYG